MLNSSHRYVAPLFAWVALTCLSQSCLADPKPKIFIDGDECSSDTSARLVHAIREQVRRSAGFTLATSMEDAAASYSIVCLDGPESDSAVIYSYAVTLNIRGLPLSSLVTHGVGKCGSSRILVCAESALAVTDQLLVGANRHLREWRKHGSEAPAD